jgi:hypothetical protein
MKILLVVLVMTLQQVQLKEIQEDLADLLF